MYYGVTPRASRTYATNYTKIRSGSLQFKNNIVIILDSIVELGYEDWFSVVLNLDLVFKTKTALIKACSLLGTSLDKRSSLSFYQMGKHVFRVKTDTHTLWSLRREFQTVLSIMKDGYKHCYKNSYSDVEYVFDFKPPEFNTDLQLLGFNPYFGAFNSKLYVSEYLRELRENKEEKIYNYYFNISKADIHRLWGYIDVDEYSRAKGTS